VVVAVVVVVADDDDDGDVDDDGDAVTDDVDNASAENTADSNCRAMIAANIDADDDAFIFTSKVESLSWVCGV